MVVFVLNNNDRFCWVEHENNEDVFQDTITGKYFYVHSNTSEDAVDLLNKWNVNLEISIKNNKLLVKDNNRLQKELDVANSKIEDLKKILLLFTGLFIKE